MFTTVRQYDIKSVNIQVNESVTVCPPRFIVSSNRKNTAFYTDCPAYKVQQATLLPHPDQLFDYW